MSAEELDRLLAGLKALAADRREIEAPPRVEARLVEAFRARQAAAATLPRSPRRTWWMPMAAWAAVGVAAASLLLFVARERPPAQVHRAPHSTLQLAVVTQAEAADDGEFIPLPNAESIAPGEEVDVVRVEVPRSAILALGLPVGEDSAGEKVTADIALGADGMARAVRILDE